MDRNIQIIRNYSLATILCLSSLVYSLSLSAQSTDVEPNIFFLIDDTEPMDYEVALRPGASIHGGPNSGVLDFSPNEFSEDRELCVGYNSLAYDPNVTYLPWSGVDINGDLFSNADITQALNNPYDPANGFRDLTNVDGTGRSTVFGIWMDSDADGRYDSGECPTATVDGGGFTSRVFFAPFFIFVDTLGTNPDPRYYNPTTGLNHSEQTNFANWYSYYRKREYTMKKAVGDIIYHSKSRLGLATVWNRNNVGTPIRDMSFTADKSNLLENLYRIDSSNINAPIRRALNEVGKYFDTISNPNPSNLNFHEPSPILPAPEGAYQNNAVVLVTGSTWNGGSFFLNVGNADGDFNSNFDGGPHADSFSNTFADIAMKWYETDLDTSLNGNVIPLEGDNNDEQHLVTHVIVLGLSGTGVITPPDHEPTTPAPPWSQPIANQNTTIDDYQHGAYNARGLFFEAHSIEEFINGVQAAYLHQNPTVISTDVPLLSWYYYLLLISCVLLIGMHKARKTYD